jgi:D-alanine-D-alanine ligase
VKITVLMGGASAERNVSLASGMRIVEALRARGHQVTAVDPASGKLSDARLAELQAGNVASKPPTLAELQQLARGGKGAAIAGLPERGEADLAFIALHGGYGEDGTLQSLLDLRGVPYTGSGHLASALAMDKDLSKKLFRAADVTTADWAMVNSRTPNAMSGMPGEGPRLSARDAEGIIGRLGLPVIVKPSKQGSTVGLTVVKEAGQLVGAVEEAFKYDDEVMVERFIPGRELTVGILGGEALPVGEIIPKHEIYDYECKYNAGMAREEFPAKLDARQSKEVQEAAQRAFGALKLRGYARIDFRLHADGTFYCLEANTLPGMTELSLIPQAAAAAGMDFESLCEKIVEISTK